MNRAAPRLAFEAKRRSVLRRSDRIFREGMSREGWSPAELATYQLTKAVAHARFAMSSTSFYREFYTSSGIRERDLDDPQAFFSLPIVEKAHVREHFDGFRTAEATEHGVLSVTGGSTGQPLHVLRDGRVSAQPLEWRLLRWWGIHPSDDIALIWRQTRTGRQALLHQAAWWPSRRLELDAYQMGEDEVRAFVDQWRRTRPALLTGYAGGVLEFARLLARLGVRLPPPRAVATTASPLTAENRAEVAEILAAPVYDHYRSAEIPWMGGECRHRSGHHIFADHRVVEVLAASGAPTDGLGRVVATDFTNRVFPLIRYRLGDRTRVLAGPCPCGSPLPRIDHVVGKEGDGLRLPSGSWVAAEAIYQLFSQNPSAVRQYHVHQRPDYSVAVQIMAGEATERDSSAFVEETLDALRARLGNQVPITWGFVPEIQHHGGKIRYVVSDVTSARSPS